MIKTVFNGVIYNTGRQADLITLINKKLEGENKGGIIIVHINLRNYYYMSKSMELLEFIRSKCFVLLEGIGMKSAFYLKGLGRLKDLNGTDSIPEFLKQLKEGTGIFLLGSEKHIVTSAGEKIRTNYPNIEIKGTLPGYFPIEEEENAANTIITSGAEILLIGRGFPLEVEFIMRKYGKLNKLIIWNVGGLFDFLSGNKRRAPKIFRLMRLEWIYRMMKEPRRMLFRNTVAAYSTFFDIFTRRK